MLVLRHVSGNRLEQLVGRQAQAAGQSFDLIGVRDAAPTFDERNEAAQFGLSDCARVRFA